MKKIIFLLLIGSVLFTRCEFINTKILGKASAADTLAAYLAKMDSIRIADSIRMAEAEQARLDSLAALDEDDEKAPVSSGRYHVITGSFKTSSFADRYRDKMISNFGYKSTTVIQARNGFNLVSVQQCESFRQAINQGRSSNMEFWIYTSN